MSEQTSIKSHAKLNLSLLIYKARKDGYHPIRSIFQTLSLYDTLTIQPISEKTLRLSSSHPDVPTDEKNILFKVYTLIKDQIPHGFKISIEKNIPMGGGLGGGSSNAAAFITYLLKHYPQLKSRLNNQTIGLKIGADVPFFLQGKTALVSGIGEKCRVIPPKLNHPIFLISPGIHCDTKKIYQTFDKKVESAKHPGPTPKWMIQNHSGKNDFKDIVFTLYPELRIFENDLLEIGVSPLFISGSGSTLFLLIKNPDNLKKAKTLITKKYPHFKTFETQPLHAEAIHILHA